MNMNCRTILAAVAGLAGAARAQFFATPGPTVSFNLTWQEDPAFQHNDNGILEAGERAIILVSLSFTGQNATAGFSPAIGPFSSGTVRGFGGAYLDIVNLSPDPFGLYNGGITTPTYPSAGPNTGTSGTSGYGVRGGWRLGGNMANGTPAANGFRNVGPGQFPTNPGQVNALNPITNLYRLGWTPASYAPRSATFTVRPAADAGPTVAALYMDFDGGTTGGVAFVPLESIQFGAVVIPVETSGPCWANCDGGTTPPILNVLDFGCFLNRFAAGDSYANCDGSTTPPVLNVLDFSCFLNRFAVGCQ